MGLLIETTNPRSDFGKTFQVVPATAGAVLNVYTHLLGYSIGFTASYLTFYVTDSVG